MDENKSSFFAMKKQKEKTETRGALTVINGDINTRKRAINALKVSCKAQRQEKCVINPYLSTTQKFQIFEEEDTENITCNVENDTISDASVKSSLIKSPSSPECIELSPEVQKESLFSYAKKKKEKKCSDLTWCTPYRQDIYKYFIEIEKKFRPNPDYMDKQLDLNMQMRCILVDWIVEVGEEYKLQAETLYHAVSYVDRFLSLVSVVRGKLQLVGTTSMFLAAKYEEIYPPELTDFVFITDNTYTKKQILRMEHLILKVLNFDISVPTAYTFLQLFCSMCNAPEVLINLSQYILELSLLDGIPFLKFVPSHIAAAALALANYVLGHAMWNKSMEVATGIEYNDLFYLIGRLHQQVISIPSRPQRSIYEKYKSPKYGSVATIKYPDTLECYKKK